jgi:peroxiredoxin
MNSNVITKAASYKLSIRGNAMKKRNLIIWILASALVFAAIYIIYDKSRPQTNQSDPDKKTTAKKPEKISEDKLLKQMTQVMTAPEFELKDLKGKTVKLSDYKGKIVFINFWATWCPYCVDEMPELQKARESLIKLGKAEILAVDIQESKELAKAFAEKKKLTLPILLDTKGSVSSLYMEPYGLNGIPVTFIINPDGTVYNIIGGATNKDTILAYVEYMGKNRKNGNKP